MKNILTLSLSLSLALAAQAQLAPWTEAPLYRHMLEVNAQWAKADPALASRTEHVHFTNEAERIAHHLHLVSDHLRSHAPEGLSADAATRRAALLDDLDRYADRGLFPQNQVLPFRNPIFIDHHGTACAVGRLMIESGHRDLAESISRDMNLAYVHDMKRADVLHWAAQEGFTEDELAWVQPGYPPTVTWTPLAGGTNGTVKAMLNLPDQSLLVAGEFTEAGGVAAQNVAIFQNGGFVALGAGVQGTITCAATNSDGIYLGGYNLNGINDLAHWDGTQWDFTTVFQGKMPLIFALQVLNDTLYAAGETMGFVGADEYVMRKDGPAWQTVPGIFNAPIRCLGTHQGKLVAGGDFTSVQEGPVTTAMHVATLDAGGWEQTGDGLNGQVFTLLDVQAMLYAGGAMYANASPVFGLARISPGAPAWEQLMPNLGDYVPIFPGTTQVRALLADGDQVYMAGDFHLNLFTLTGTHLARFLGTADVFEPLAYFNAPVNALASDPFISDAHGLYAGGEFTQNIGDTVPYLAEALLNTAVQEAEGNTSMSLWPNPATDQLTITFADGASRNATVEVLDAQGRRVLTQTLPGRSGTLDIRTLATGTYTVRPVGHDDARARTFVKR